MAPCAKADRIEIAAAPANSTPTTTMVNVRRVIDPPGGESTPYNRGKSYQVVGVDAILEVSMKGELTLAIALSFAAVALPANAQWLNHPTPNIPRTSDGKPNLAAPPPRAADGHVDLSGPW